MLIFGWHVFYYYFIHITAQTLLYIKSYPQSAEHMTENHILVAILRTISTMNQCRISRTNMKVRPFLDLIIYEKAYTHEHTCFRHSAT